MMMCVRKKWWLSFVSVCLLTALPACAEELPTSASQAEVQAQAAMPESPPQVVAAVAVPDTLATVNAEDARDKASAAADTQEYVYKLNPGNKIKLSVFGEEDLSGEFEIDATGSLSLPLAGTIQAAGLEPRELEKIITEKLLDGYLLNPRVRLEVLNYKPVFILGEVNKPGSYPYVNGLTVINAVALGGGFTYRAKTSSVVIIRERAGQRNEIRGTEKTPVYPGDTIQVEERLF